MKVLLAYQNALRDFRAYALLASCLRSLGHKVWIQPSWRGLISASLHKVDVYVTGQVSELATCQPVSFCKERNIKLVIFSTEQYGSLSRPDPFVSSSSEKVNANDIDLQVISSPNVWKYLEKTLDHQQLSLKYCLLDFPRFDFSINPLLSTVETDRVSQKYKISSQSKNVLFVSSFLFWQSFEDQPQEDIKRYNYEQLAQKNAAHFLQILPLLKNVASCPGVRLFIKRHPWDNSCEIEKHLIKFANISIVDNSDYITPWLDLADVILHTHSTACIEAILSKPRKPCAILANSVRDISHQDAEYLPYQSTISDYNQIDANDFCLASSAAHSYFSIDGLDGFATMRFALEIHDKFSTHKSNSHGLPTVQNFKETIRESAHYMRVLSRSHPSNSAASQLQSAYEKHLPTIARLYSKPFRNYVVEGLRRFG